MAEHSPGDQVDIEVTGVVRQSNLLDHRPHVQIDGKAVPDGVGVAGLGVRQSWIALGEVEGERVADGHRESGEDQVERDDQQHQRRR